MYAISNVKCEPILSQLDPCHLRACEERLLRFPDDGRIGEPHKALERKAPDCLVSVLPCVRTRYGQGTRVCYGLDSYS